MIGRIHKHFFLRPVERVPGLASGCIACYAHNGAREIEDEEHLLFRCCTTSRLRTRLWAALTESEAQICAAVPPGKKLEALIMSERIELWQALAEVFFRIWCRPSQAWRRHQANRQWRHTDP